MADSLHRLAADLWIAESPRSFLGLVGQLRMTVVRIADRALWLHSPIPPEEDLLSAVREIGEPRCLIAPNRVHYLSIAAWSEIFPEARVHVAPDLPRRRPKLLHDAVLGETADAEWSSQLEQLYFSAAPFYGEVVFCHRASGTLILTDLVINLDELGWSPGALIVRLGGAGTGFRPPRPLRMLMRDRALAREQLDRILSWDFDRIVMSHGAVIETGGKARLEDAFSEV